MVETSSLSPQYSTGGAQASAPKREYQDCLSCRVMGTSQLITFVPTMYLADANHTTGAATFMGTGAYCFTVRPEQVPPSKQMPANRVAAMLVKQKPKIPRVLGVGFVALGLYRFWV